MMDVDIDLIGELAALWTPPPPRPFEPAVVDEIRRLLRDQPRCQDVGHEGKKGATQFSNDDGEGCDGAEGSSAKGDKPEAKSGAETAAGEDRGDTALNESAQQPNVENQKRPEPGQGLGKWFETHPEEYEEYKRNLFARQKELVDKGLTTDALHTIDEKRQVYTPERTAQQDKLLDEAEAKLATGIPAERVAVVMGGLPGAGKTTALRGHAQSVGIDPSQFAEVGADNFKEAIVEHGMVERYPGLPPMEAAELIHQESRKLAERFFGRLVEKGTNIALDSTMSNSAPFLGREGYIERLRAAGYKVKMIFVDTTPETSLRRAKKRHLLGMDSPNGGRTIPDYAITGEASRSQRGFNSRARDTFEDLKSRADEWYLFDSEVDGAPPLLTGSWDNRHKVGDKGKRAFEAELDRLLGVIA